MRIIETMETMAEAIEANSNAIIQFAPVIQLLASRSKSAEEAIERLAGDSLDAINALTVLCAVQNIALKILNDRVTRLEGEVLSLRMEQDDYEYR